MTICTACGATQKDEAAKFCASCGAPMGVAAKAAPSDSAKDERVLFEGSPAAIGTIGAFLLTLVLLGIPWLFYWIAARSTHYKLTNRRIVVERGIFSKRLEQIDIYRVQDYVVERPFGQRLLGTGNLVIQASDRTTGEVRIERVRADVRELYEKLREATEQDKRSRGVRVLDVE
jgi:uncharacterized membrane protein YdbT with pleckstrin-like domain